jgi:hypothetical protein
MVARNTNCCIWDIAALGLHSDCAAGLCRWYGSHAVVIKESDKDVAIELLEKALSEAPRPITAEEMAEIRAKFSWEVIVPAFYERIAHELQCLPCRARVDRQSLDEVKAAIVGKQ